MGKLFLIGQLEEFEADDSKQFDEVCSVFAGDVFDIIHSEQVEDVVHRLRCLPKHFPVGVVEVDLIVGG